MRSRTSSAYVTFLIRSDSFLPGALLQAFALRSQQTTSDIVCLVTEDISGEAVDTLSVIFDFVVRINSIYVTMKTVSSPAALAAGVISSASSMLRSATRTLVPPPALKSAKNFLIPY